MLVSRRKEQPQKMHPPTPSRKGGVIQDLKKCHSKGIRDRTAVGKGWSEVTASIHAGRARGKSQGGWRGEDNSGSVLMDGPHRGVQRQDMACEEAGRREIGYFSRPSLPQIQL